MQCNHNLCTASTRHHCILSHATSSSIPLSLRNFKAQPPWLKKFALCLRRLLHIFLQQIMEGLSAASGVIAVVSLAGQIVQGCGYLHTVFDEAKSAPQEIHLLMTELAIIEGVVRTTPDVDKHQDELDFCHERLLKLRNIVEKYGILDGTGRSKKWGTRSRST
jgi:hypothetical protein